MAIISATEFPTVKAAIADIEEKLLLPADHNEDGLPFDVIITADEAAWWFDAVTGQELIPPPETFALLGGLHHNAIIEEDDAADAPLKWAFRYQYSYDQFKKNMKTEAHNMHRSRFMLYMNLQDQMELASKSISQNRLHEYLVHWIQERLLRITKWSADFDKFEEELAISNKNSVDGFKVSVESRVNMFNRAEELKFREPQQGMSDLFSDVQNLMGFLYTCRWHIAKFLAPEGKLVPQKNADGQEFMALTYRQKGDVQDTVTFFNSVIEMWQTELDAAIDHVVKILPEVSSKMTALGKHIGALNTEIQEVREIAEDKIQGIRLRSFREQRSLSLAQLSEAVAPLMDKETTPRTLAVRLSRFEGGTRGARGYPGDLALCTALNCTARELTKAPLGYHLRSARITQIIFDEKGDASFVTRPRYVSGDISKWADIIKEKEHPSRADTSLAYLPPVGTPPLDEMDQIELVYFIIRYHWQSSVKKLNELGFPTQVDLPASSEETYEAATIQKNAVDWAAIAQSQKPLFSYVKSVLKEDGQTYKCEAGYAWDQKWFSLEADEKLSAATPSIEVIRADPDPAPKIQDEVAASAHPSNYPAPVAQATIPVLGYARGGAYDMQFVDNGNAFEEIETPPVLTEVRDAFAVVVSNDSMEPRYDAGDYLYCHPNKVPKRGDYVVCALTEQRAVVKRFVRQTPDTIELEQLNPAEPVSIQREDVVRLFVIVGTKTA